MRRTVITVVVILLALTALGIPLLMRDGQLTAAATEPVNAGTVHAGTVNAGPVDAGPRSSR
jgi:hypothetical protein